jgi:hypothetical protein
MTIFVCRVCDGAPCMLERIVVAPSPHACPYHIDNRARWEWLEQPGKD